MAYAAVTTHTRHVGTVENHGKQGFKNTAHFCENRQKKSRQNHGSLYSC